MFECIIENIYSFKFIFVFIVVNILILIHYFQILVKGLFEPPSKTRHVLVTGCDSGFGYLTTLALSKLKVKVYAGCLTQDGVDRLKNDPNFNGVAFILDVTKEEDIEKAYNMIKEEVGDKGIGKTFLIRTVAIIILNKTKNFIRHTTIYFGQILNMSIYVTNKTCIYTQYKPDKI